MSQRPRRILLLNYEYPPLGGGAGNATANLARELADLGQDVRVVTAAFDGLPRDMIVDGYRLRRIPALRRHADHCSPLEMLAFAASAAVFLPIMARSWRPDTCIAFFGIPCGPPAWWLRTLCGVPYIISLRGGDVPGFQPYDLAAYHRLTAPVIHLLWRGASHVVANSHGLAALARRSAGAVPIAVIPNGVDTDRFTPAADRPPSDTVRLCFVGRLVRQKGLDTLLAALAKLPATAPWRLTLVGDGPARPELSTQADHLGLAERVHFAGWTIRDALPRLLVAHDLFVFPSRDEGMPNAVLEAMAAGLPVIATAIAGNEELVLPDRTGLLVPPDDPDALADALDRCLGDAALRRAFGHAGRERAVREYAWGRVAEVYLRLCTGEG